MGYKISAKFRFSKENANEFSFLSVRNLSKSSEKPNFGAVNAEKK
jgi:hypothetical protein